MYKVFFNLHLPQFPLRGKVGKLSKRKRVISWSTVSLLLVSRGAQGGGFPSFK